MLIACKCLNIILSSSDQNHAAISASNKILESITSLNNLDELQKNPRTRRIHSNCLEFIKLATGPISDLSITINQNDLIYKVPIDSWFLNYCINCNQITFAKHKTDAIYLINTNLLTNNEEINSLKTNKSFSTAFSILMIDNPIITVATTTPSSTININETIIGDNINNSTNDSIMFQLYRSNSVSSNYNNDGLKQQLRLRRLNNMVQNRLQKEIQDTNERIRRYTEQQFALLKSYRDKTEQEYQILVSLVNQVPEQLKAFDAIDNLQNYKTTDGYNNKITPTTSPSIIDPIINSNNIGAINNTQQRSSTLFPYKTSVLSAATAAAAAAQQQQQLSVSSLDTPPATPDSTPMSVGNSPTFRQLQQQQTNNFGIDCQFELEGLENNPMMRTTSSVNQGIIMSDVDETEDADNDAVGELDMGIPITKFTNRRGSQNTARSLPISISNNYLPNTIATVSKFNYEDLEDEVADETTAVDIAASIKALAKSVHGDKIFGDLPRPRFSTQI